MRANNTIAAISTSLNESGIGIIRVSGDNSIEIVDKIYKGKNSLINANTHTINYGHIIYENEIIDEVLVMLMKAPRTYTGEDTVEINCHGGILVTQKILKAVINSGAYIAESGEFTKRAFLNGKMDLSQAEAVIDIINAKNNYALKSGVMQLKGKLKSEIIDLREDILYEIAYIESALDDPEYYNLDNYPRELNEKLINIKFRMEKLISSFNNGKIIKEGIDTVIIGRPNAGKSSLLNLLLGEERAIVTDIAGTTRDTITENINIHDISLNITDTAGIRESEDLVEKIGVKKALDKAYNADFIILVIDASDELRKEDIELIKSIDEKNSVILLNKIDKKVKINIEDINKYTTHEILYFSTINGEGKLNLENLVKEKFYKGELNFNDELYITNIRHKDALDKAIESINKVLESIKIGLEEDFFSIDLLDAYEKLGVIIGESLEEDLINEIFSKFCMGK